MNVLLAIAAVVAIVYYWYASIVSKRNKVGEAFSSIEVQLKQRLDLIPNILTIAKQFMEHEKVLLTEITELRTQLTKPPTSNDANTMGSYLSAVEQLSTKMGQLMVNVENYPTLKSDQTMTTAMKTYNEVEAQIAAARRFYNAAVTSFNNSIQIFPGTLIAERMGATVMPFFKAEESVYAPVNASQYLG
jgi:LemA protein